eukprot:5135516-Amphidinium_carterae.1
MAANLFRRCLRRNTSLATVVTETLLAPCASPTASRHGLITSMFWLCRQLSSTDKSAPAGARRFADHTVA